MRTRETYREATPFGDDVWVQFAHPDLPPGFAVERTTTHRVTCTRCQRFRVLSFEDGAWREQLAEHERDCPVDTAV